MSERMRLAVVVVLPIVVSGCGIANGLSGGDFCSPFVIGGCAPVDDPILDAELQPRPEPVESFEFTQTTAALEGDRVSFEIALPLDYPARREMVIIVAPGSSACLDGAESIIGAAFDAGLAVVRIEPEDGANSLDVAWAGLQSEEFGVAANDSLTSVVVEGDHFDSIDGSRIGDSSFLKLLLLSPSSTATPSSALVGVHPGDTRIFAAISDESLPFVNTLATETEWTSTLFDSVVGGCALASGSAVPTGGGPTASDQTRSFLGLPLVGGT